MDAKKRTVARIYRACDSGIWGLMGPAAAGVRAEILTIITGQRVPKSKAGLNAAETAMFQLFGAGGDCLAARRDSLDSIVSFYEGE